MQIFLQHFFTSSFCFWLLWLFLLHCQSLESQERKTTQKKKTGDPRLKLKIIFLTYDTAIKCRKFSKWAKRRKEGEVRNISKISRNFGQWTSRRYLGYLSSLRVSSFGFGEEIHVRPNENIKMFNIHIIFPDSSLFSPHFFVVIVGWSFVVFFSEISPMSKVNGEDEFFFDLTNLFKLCSNKLNEWYQRSLLVCSIHSHRAAKTIQNLSKSSRVKSESEVHLSNKKYFSLPEPIKVFIVCC